GRDSDRLEPVRQRRPARRAVEPPPPVPKGKRVPRLAVLARPPGLFGFEPAVGDPAAFPRALDRLAPEAPLLVALRLADRAAVLAELQHDFRHVPQPPDLAQPQPQVQVLCRLE